MLDFTDMLLDFVSDRVREEVEKVEDPVDRFRAWKKWTRENRASCDWVDVGQFGAPRYIPGMIEDLDELRRLAYRWRDHPHYPVEAPDA